MGKLIQRSDLEDAMSSQTVLSLFDDGSNNVSDSAVNLCINRAEAEVFSYLVGVYPNPPPDTDDNLLKSCAIDFAVCFAYDRKPEYARNNGMLETLKTRWTNAVDRMQRIQSAIQQPPDLSKAVTPANVGGFTVDDSNRLTLSDPITGASNMGDF